MIVETIVKAAIIVDDVIYTGWRHCFIIHDYCQQHNVNKCPPVNHKGETVSNQGFVTDTGRFVTREEAYNIVKANGQVVVKHGGTVFCSEDLWNVEGKPYTLDSKMGLCEGKT